MSEQGGYAVKKDVHVNHLVHWPGPHGKKEVDLIADTVIAGVVEDHQENQGD